MKKEEIEQKDIQSETENNSIQNDDNKSDDNKKNIEIRDESLEKITPEKEIEELKDKLARTFAEMENQRRRYEKEKDDAFEYGGFSFARESLNLLDNLERSKISLEND